jgi:hypothetical protein
MKTLLTLFIWAALAIAAYSQAPVRYEYMQISAIESVVPGGLGRSRLISTSKEGQMMEKELLNFFSLVGINFGNVQNNDRVIATRLNELAEEGWDLYSVNSGVYGPGDKTGIFITRYVFRRPAK